MYQTLDEFSQFLVSVYSGSHGLKLYIEPEFVQPQLHRLFSDHKMLHEENVLKRLTCGIQKQTCASQPPHPSQFKAKINNRRDNKSLCKTPSAHAGLTQHRGTVVRMVWKTPTMQQSQESPLPSTVLYSSPVLTLQQLCVQKVMCC